MEIKEKLTYIPCLLSNKEYDFALTVSNLLEKKGTVDLQKIPVTKGKQMSWSR